MNLPPDALRPCSRCIYRVVRDEKEWCRFPGSDNEMKTKEARHTDGHCQADGLHYVENPVIRRENSVLWHERGGSMPEMRIVKFNQGYQKYNKDETAGFPVDIANRLCQQNRDTGKSIATLVGDGTPEPTPEPGLNGPRAEAAIPGLNLGPLVEVVKGQQEQIAQLTQAVTQQSRAVGKLIEAIMQQNERERGSR